MASIAQQLAEFDPDSLLVDATTATRYSGQIRVGNRAVPSAWGDVLFRVPSRLETTLVFDGTLSWTGSASSWSGSFQVISIPNTGSPSAPVVNFGYHPSYVRQGATSGTISQAVTLQGGVYRLKWHIGHDAFDGPKSDGEAKLKMNLKFTDDIACKDAFGPAELRWPVHGGYTAKILRAETEEYREAPECKVDDSPACWKQRKVLFKIQKGERTTGPYVGWAYVPGTLRRHKDYPLSCKEIDPRYNCHGYMFAGSMLWLEEEAINGILADNWCRRMDVTQDAWRPGEVRLWRTVEYGQRVTPQGSTTPWFYRAPDHSQMMMPERDVLDEKLGAMAYARPDRHQDLTRAKGVAEYYRCDF